LQFTKFTETKINFVCRLNSNAAFDTIETTSSKMLTE